MGSTWTRIDAAADPVAMVESQRSFSSTPFARTYKRRSFDLLRTGPSGRVLDVGCGPGIDLAEMRARYAVAVGVDNSLAMATLAGQPVLLGDAVSLPFADGAFDGVRADRVLQHLDDPAAALADMTRVVRSGGWVVAADPDQTTLFIDAGDEEVSAGLVGCRRAAWPSADLGHRMAGLMREHGLREVVAEEFRYDTTNPHWAFGIETWPEIVRDQGLITEAECERWKQVVAAALSQGRLRYGVTFFVTAGRVA